MPTSVLVDGNSVGYFEHYGTKLTQGDIQTQQIFGYCHRARNLKIGYHGCDILVLWDGRAQWRFDMCPSYKSNRDDDPRKAEVKREYQKARPYITRALQHLGIKQLTSVGDEADDLGGLLTNKLISAQPDNRVVLQTGDHDWYQLIRPGVILRDQKDPKFVLKPENFTEVTGYKTPIAFLEGKALQGDNSDVIPGIDKLGEKTAAEFLAEWGSVFNFFKAVDSGQYTPKARASKTAKSLHPEQLLASLEGRKLFLRNLRMMNLLNPKPPAKGDLEIIPGKVDREKFIELCEELNFASILKDVDNFLEPFTKGQ